MSVILTLFGSPHVKSDAKAIALPTKQIALLAILAAEHPKSVGRNYLAALLWPKSSRQAARHSLSQALYGIRRTLGDPVVYADSSAIRLADVTCDLVEFRSYMAAGAYEQAAGIVTGRLCDMLEVSGCVDFEHRLEELRLQTSRQVGLLLAEPLKSGVRLGLCDRLGLSPDHRGRLEREAVDNSDTVGFVGRVTERATLENVWAASTDGMVCTALVTGEPGIGKTTLCQRVVKKSVLRGSNALTAAGYEIQRNIPYGIIGQLLGGLDVQESESTLDPKWVEILVRHFPDVGLLHNPISAPPLDVPAIKGDWEVSSQLAGAVNHVLSRSARVRPLTIFVDDVQWADPASMSVLHYVAHWDRTLPIFVLLASRPRDLELLEHDRWNIATTVPLQGLTLPEARLIIENIHSSNYADRDTEWIHELSGGNPLLIKALVDRGGLDIRRLPQTAKRYFGDEVAKLSTQAQEVGAALSAIAEPISIGQLKWVTESDEGQLNAGLHELVSQGYVDRDAGAFALRHELVREAFLDNLAPVASARLHGRVARFLRDEGKPATVVASQLTIAANDAQTCKYGLAAAKASTRLYAYREAEHFYRIAIASASSTAVELQSRIGLSTILLWQGRSRDAENVLRDQGNLDALTRAEVALLEAHTFIAELSETGPAFVADSAFARAMEIEHLLPLQISTKLFACIAGNAQHGRHELFQAAIEAMDRTLQQMAPGPERLENELHRSALRTTAARKSTDLAELDRLTAESAQWPLTYAAGLSAAGAVRVFQGKAREAEKWLLQALEVCERFGFLDQRIRVLNNLGVCFLEQGRWEEAEEQFQCVVRLAGSVAPKEIPSAMTNLTILEYERQNYDQTIALASQYLHETSLKIRLRLGVLSVSGLAHLAAGQLSRARKREHEVRTTPGYDALWSNDVSYLEMFLARMTIIDGKDEVAKRRLGEKINAFPAPYFYGNARMQVELLRILSTEQPEVALEQARELRPTLAAAHAAPLTEEVDQLITRCSPAFRAQPR